MLTVLIGEKTHTHTKGKNRLRPFSFLTFSLFTYGLVVIGTFMPHSLYQVHCSALVSDVAFIGFPFFFHSSHTPFFFFRVCVWLCMQGILVFFVFFSFYVSFFYTIRCTNFGMQSPTFQLYITIPVERTHSCCCQLHQFFFSLSL